MPKVTIDGKEYEAAAGQTIIQVALAHGVEIPHFCWHPALSVAGNCRMCLVEIEKMPKLAIACATPIADGMVVKTTSPNAAKGREDVMEFLLINHPLDCPICDEAGQCKLQDYEFEHSRGESRFVEEKVHKDKRVPFGPNVLFDAERCISCSRCIRFSTEIAHQPVLTFVDRGDHVTIEATPYEGLNNINSMNVIDICPVGALTSRDFRFKSRVWDMSFTDSVCPGCSRGCDIRVGVRNNEILRLEPRPNPNVNDFWMCDHGRLNAYPEVNAANRISGPKLRTAGALATTTWEIAEKTIADKLRSFKPEEVLFIASGVVPLEDNYLFAKLAKSKFGAKTIQYVSQFEGVDDRLLLRADRSANSAGLALLGIEPITLAALANQIASKNIKAVYALEGVDILADDAVRQAFGKVAFFACHATNENQSTLRADVVLAAATWAEREGVLVNFTGWVQKLRPAVATSYMVRGRDHLQLSRLDRFGALNDTWARSNKRDAIESWRSIRGVAAVLGLQVDYLHTEDLFEEIASSVPQFKGMDYDTLGDQGLPTVGRNGEEHGSIKPALYHEVAQEAQDRSERFAIAIPEIA
jgi:NADH-quinone oxidoreductase subunit G